MTFHYNGKYNGDPKSLPGHEPVTNAVRFREPENSRTLGLVANGIALVLFLVFAAVGIWRSRYFWNGWALLLYFAILVPHEFLHAICFKEDVYMYQNLKQGMLFVIGPESMSKGRFIFMSLLPNIVFGLVPYGIYLICPQLNLLGSLGCLALVSGAGDYLNVFNALTQMPKGSRTYLYEFHSWWYLPEEHE